MIHRVFEWIEPKARFYLSSWYFWIGMAYLGLTLTVVFSLATFQKVSRQEAISVALEQADHTNRVAACYREFAEAPALWRFIEAQLVIARNQSNVFRVNLSVLPDDPRASGPQGWRVSLGKVRTTIGDLKAFLQQSKVTTPSRMKCDRLAERLGLPRQDVGSE